MFFLFTPLRLALHVMGALCFLFFSIILMLSCLMTVTGFIGYHHWMLDLTSHFHFQYLIVQSIGLLFLAFESGSLLSKGFRACFLFIFILINASLIVPYYLTPVDSTHITPVAKTSAPTPLKILHMNVYARNFQYLSVEREIQKMRPDLISLAEYTRWWQKTLSLRQTFHDYPYRMVLPAGQIALYSRIPFESIHVDYSYRVQGDPIILAQIQWPAASPATSIDYEPVTLMIAHPFSPVRHAFWERNREHYKRIINLGKRFPQHLVIVGDLNSTLWSTGLQQVIQTLHLRDAQLGFGYQPTWPSYFPPLLIPIDHCLVSRDMQVLISKTGDNTGSDHLPLYVELSPLD